MREDPRLDANAIAACLRREYGLAIKSLRFLPHGLDPHAAAYQAEARDGSLWFVKIRFGPVDEASLRLTRALIGRGVGHVLAPLRTRSSALWVSLEEDAELTLVVFPFVAGKNAMNAGLSDDQWRTFGATLRAVHDSGLADQFRGEIRTESFSLPSAALVRELLSLVHSVDMQGAVARVHASFWRERTDQIEALLDRAEAIAERLRYRSFDMVLCHADIHAANILVGDDGGIVLIDWDFPLIAPRERDFLFIVGSQIARRVEPREEDLFFAGYGPVAIDREALAYFRYERIIEDIGEFAKSVFLDPDLSEEARAEEAAMAVSFFVPGGQIAHAEVVELRPQWLPGD